MPSTRRLPTHSISGSQVKIEIPTAWYCTIVGISRKTYNQTVRIRNSLLKGHTFLESKFGKSNETLKGALSRAGTTVYAANKAPSTLTIDFFHSKEADKSGAGIADPRYQSNKAQAVTFSKSARVAKSVPDYRSYFIFVEDGPDSERTPGDIEFDDVVLTVQMFYVPEVDVVNPNPNPPKPPSYVKPGYNENLDRPRESTIENYLKYYDTVFLVDDSGSMNEPTSLGAKKWDECIDALISITNKAMSYDDDGIEYYFFNNANFTKHKLKDFADVTEASAALRQVTANGGTPTGSKVRERLEAHLNVLAANIDNPVAYGKVKPLDLIVITDGSPDANNRPLPVVVEIAARMKAARYHPNAIGIQFVQIGNDAGAEESLKTMAGATNVGSMVDTVPYESALTPAQLERILLGALHPNLRPGYTPGP